MLSPVYHLVTLLSFESGDLGSSKSMSKSRSESSVESSAHVDGGGDTGSAGAIAIAEGSECSSAMRDWKVGNGYEGRI